MPAVVTPERVQKLDQSSFICEPRKHSNHNAISLRVRIERTVHPIGARQLGIDVQLNRNAVGFTGKYPRKLAACQPGTQPKSEMLARSLTHQ